MVAIAPKPMTEALDDGGLAGRAGELVPGSYLSLAWALQLYGLIPDAVREFTSVARRLAPPVVRIGDRRYSYQLLDGDLWWGFEELPLGMSNSQVRVATPAKALVDYWHVHAGVWSVERQREMRWQNLDHLDLEELAEAVRRADRPRLSEAHQAFLIVVGEIQEEWGG